MKEAAAKVPPPTGIDSGLLSSSTFGNMTFGSGLLGSSAFGSMTFDSGLLGSSAFGSGLLGSSAFGSMTFGSGLLGSSIGSGMGGSRVQRMRLDQALFQRGLTTSRESARALVLAGAVEVDGQPAAKAGRAVTPQSQLRIVKDALPYVSRGGNKLKAALTWFNIAPQGRIALDAGASSGGFTDCLLQEGAASVYAVDVGYGQLAWKLRQDHRVIVMERTHILRLLPEQLEKRPSLITVDLSFISLQRVLPHLVFLLAADAEDRAEIIALLKPQFEVGKGLVERGGRVTDSQVHEALLAQTTAQAQSLGLETRGVRPSPLRGKKSANLEFLIHLQRRCTMTTSAAPTTAASAR